MASDAVSRARHSSLTSPRVIGWADAAKRPAEGGDRISEAGTSIDVTSLRRFDPFVAGVQFGPVGARIDAQGVAGQVEEVADGELCSRRDLHTHPGGQGATMSERLVRGDLVDRDRVLSRVLGPEGHDVEDMIFGFEGEDLVGGRVDGAVDELERQAHLVVGADQAAGKAGYAGPLGGKRRSRGVAGEVAPKSSRSWPPRWAQAVTQVLPIPNAPVHRSRHGRVVRSFAAAPARRGVKGSHVMSNHEADAVADQVLGTDGDVRSRRMRALVVSGVTAPRRRRTGCMRGR